MCRGPKPSGGTSLRRISWFPKTKVWCPRLKLNRSVHDRFIKNLGARDQYIQILINLILIKTSRYNCQLTCCDRAIHIQCGGDPCRAVDRDDLPSASDHSVVSLIIKNLCTLNLADIPPSGDLLIGPKPEGGRALEAGVCPCHDPVCVLETLNISDVERLTH